MALPKYDDIMPLALDYLASDGLQSWRSLEEPLALKFELSTTERAEEYTPGNGLVFLDRLSRALSCLNQTKLIQRPKRGYCEITELGKQYIDKPEQLRTWVKTKAAERDAANKASKSNAAEAFTAPNESHSSTPTDDLFQACKTIKSASFDAILDTILGKTPTEFENLVVRLLEAIGYGGQVKNAGTVTQASNDGGIDGFIKEDVLGLGKIHIQAKRLEESHGILGITN